MYHFKAAPNCRANSFGDDGFLLTIEVSSLSVTWGRKYDFYCGLKIGLAKYLEILSKNEKK